jgi:hypothetical protein
VWVGSALGSRLGRTEPDVGRRLWQGMITQVHYPVTLHQETPSWSSLGVLGSRAVEHGAAALL